MSLLGAIRRLFVRDPGACGVKRSPKWPALRDAWLKLFPRCAVCGTDKGVVPHHCVPVHVASSLELVETNLITLCPVHHLWIGHLGDWASWNKDVEDDAKTWAQKIKTRP